MKEYSRKKVKNGVEIGFRVTENKVIFWESEDNPHGINHEISCNVNDWFSDTKDAKRIKDCIQRNFGIEALDSITQKLK